MMLLTLLLALTAHAEFAAPELVPVDRLVKNAGAFVEAHPDDADGHFTLGRIHAMAYTLDRPVVATYGERADTEMPYVAQRGEQGWVEHKGPALDEEAKAEHLAQAITHYRKAMELNPAAAEYFLSYGWILEASADKPGALAGYDQAWRIAKDRDAATKEQPLEGLIALVSYEAAMRWLEVVGEEPTKKQKKQAVQMRAHMAAIEGIELGGMTPIVFSLDGGRRLADLVDDTRVVEVDLDGDGLAERRQWLQPDTALLAWDPLHTADVADGRRLFGAVSFELMPRNGYRALDLLDDDRDGSLAGGELDGIVAWTDRNGDGRSEASEVTALSELGVVAIRVDAAGESEGVLWQPRGLVLGDGTVLPTWDWVSRSGDLRVAAVRGGDLPAAAVRATGRSPLRP